jgi:hypothetical protein
MQLPSFFGDADSGKGISHILLQPDQSGKDSAAGLEFFLKTGISKRLLL